MADRDRPSIHVQLVGVDFSDGLASPHPFLCELLRSEGLRVRRELRGECLVDVDEIDLREREPGALERLRKCEDGRHEELPPGIDSGVRPRAKVAERLVAHRLRPRLLHHEESARAVGEGRRIGGGDRAVIPIEDGRQLRVGVERRVLADDVVLGDRFASSARMYVHHFRSVSAVAPRARGVDVRAVSDCVLLLAADPVLFGHLLGGLSHELAGGRLARETGNGRHEILAVQSGKSGQFGLKRFALLRGHERVAQRTRDAEWNVAHAVGPARDGNLVVPGLDCLRGIGHRLNRSRARARHAERVGIFRQPRSEHDLARDVQPVERRHDLTVDDERDFFRRDLRPLDELLHDADSEVDRLHLAEPRPRLGKRRAKPRHDRDPVRRHGAKPNPS